MSLVGPFVAVFGSRSLARRKSPNFDDPHPNQAAGGTESLFLVFFVFFSVSIYIRGRHAPWQSSEAALWRAKGSPPAPAGRRRAKKAEWSGKTRVTLRLAATLGRSRAPCA